MLRIGVLGAKNGGRRPPMPPPPGEGGTRGSDSDRNFKSTTLAGPQIDFLHLGALADLLGGSRFQDFTEMENRDVIGDVEDDVHVMLDQENRKIAIKSQEKCRHLRRFTGG